MQSATERERFSDSAQYDLASRPPQLGRSPFFAFAAALTTHPLSPFPSPSRASVFASTRIICSTTPGFAVRAAAPASSLTHANPLASQLTAANIRLHTTLCATHCSRLLPTTREPHHHRVAAREHDHKITKDPRRHIQAVTRVSKSVPTPARACRQGRSRGIYTNTYATDCRTYACCHARRLNRRHERQHTVVARSSLGEEEGPQAREQADCRANGGWLQRWHTQTTQG